MHTPRSIIRPLLLLGVVALLVGCRAEDARFRMDMVYVRKQENATEITFTRAQLLNLSNVLAAVFGTPDDPDILIDGDIGLHEIVDLTNLKMAAGPVGSDEMGFPHGLYREHCSHCHGVTGNGLGPTAAFLNPYPRDYRQGIYKFKSTPKGSRPTTEDLKTVLINGVQGTAMPSFALLADDEIDALVDYVKYLSVRGKIERDLIFEVADELEEKELLVDPEEPDDGLETVKMYLTAEVRKWASASNEATAVPSPPASSSDEDRLDSLARGRELFHGTLANCVKCHGETALGDGQTTDYDQWTIEIFTKEPQQPGIGEFVALGALKPRNILPRNLRHGVYRGGRRPIDLYWRVRNGIDGTPMPAATMKQPGQKGLTEADIWHLIDYVRSLPYEPLSNPHYGGHEAVVERQRL